MKEFGQLEIFGDDIYEPMVDKRNPLKGIKYDEEKLDWTLLPIEELEAVIKVLQFGANKYAPDNWKLVKPSSRYTSAMWRHLSEHSKGELNDPETNLPHLAHLICCALFKMWHDKGGNDCKNQD